MFKRHRPIEWSRIARRSNWFTPEVHTGRYKLLKPGDRLDFGRSGRTPVHLAEVPPGVTAPEIITYNYSCSYQLTIEILDDLGRGVDKVLVKPNNTGFIGVFLGNPKLEEIMRRNGIERDPDLQPIATQPAMLVGIVDALLDSGVEEIHVGENMLWSGGTPRAFWETGYIQAFSRRRYSDRVHLVDFYEGEGQGLELAELRIEGGAEYLGFFDRMMPPRSLFDERYDLVIIASIAKMHNCSFYSLGVKNFSVTWNPRGRRWHVHGVPLRAFYREHAEEVLGEELPGDLRYEVRMVEPSGQDKAAFVVSNGVRSAHIKGYKEGGEWQLHVDPHHLQGLSLASLVLSMSLLNARATAMYATICKKLNERGSRVAGLVSGCVGQEGEGPLIYGRAKISRFAAASTSIPALDSVCINIMTGSGEEGFAERMLALNEGMADGYGVGRRDELLNDARDPWTLRMASELTGDDVGLDEMSYRLTGYVGRSKKPGHLWDLRGTDPYDLPRGIYCSPRTWLRLMHTERGIFEHSMDLVDKGIEVPLIPGVTLVG